jgi:hypothetical protein
MRNRSRKWIFPGSRACAICVLYRAVVPSGSFHPTQSPRFATRSSNTFGRPIDFSTMIARAQFANSAAPGKASRRWPRFVAPGNRTWRLTSAARPIRNPPEQSSQFLRNSYAATLAAVSRRQILSVFQHLGDNALVVYSGKIRTRFLRQDFLPYQLIRCVSNRLLGEPIHPLPLLGLQRASCWSESSLLPDSNIQPSGFTLVRGGP